MALIHRRRSPPATWDGCTITVSVNIDGATAQFDLYNGIGYYAQWNPAC